MEIAARHRDPARLVGRCRPLLCCYQTIAHTRPLHCGIAVPSMSASLIGRLGSSAFRLSTNSSVDVAHGLALLFGLGTKGPSIMGIRRRGGTIFRATLPSM